MKTITLSIETVDTLIRIAGHRTAAEMIATEESHANGGIRPVSAEQAMSIANVSEEMRIKACGEAGRGFTTAFREIRRDDALAKEVVDRIKQTVKGGHPLTHKETAEFLIECHEAVLAAIADSRRAI